MFSFILTRIMFGLLFPSREKADIK